MVHHSLLRVIYVLLSVVSHTFDPTRRWNADDSGYHGPCTIVDFLPPGEK